MTNTKKRIRNKTDKKSHQNDKKNQNIKTKKKIRGLIIEYSQNIQHDKFMLNYVLTTPTTGLFVLLPTINLTSNVRNDLYKYLEKYCHIKAIKKIKLDFDGIVKLINQFHTHQHKKYDILEIKKQVILDVSWEQHNKKTIYVVVYNKKSQIDYKYLEKKIKNYLIQYELNKITNNELKDYVSENNDIKLNNDYNYKINIDKTKSLQLSDYVKQSGGSMTLKSIDTSIYPLNTEDKSDEEITLNFLSNVLVDKLYLCATHSYTETTIFAKMLLTKNILKKL